MPRYERPLSARWIISVVNGVRVAGGGRRGDAGKERRSEGAATENSELRTWYSIGMQQQLMEILVCPMCKADLELTTTREEGGEIIEGKLTCTQCRETYPIEDGIPNLLPPDQRD